MSEGCEVPLMNAPSAEIRALLEGQKVIAIVGLSDKPDRDSNRVARYLIDQGYTVVPVNPTCESILGLRCHPSVAEVPGEIGIVDIFRKPEAVPGIVEEAIRRKAKAVWMQEGIVNNRSAAVARAAGLAVVMNKCIMKEHRKLMAAETGKKKEESEG